MLQSKRYHVNENEINEQTRRKKEAKTIIGTFRQSSKYIESIERIFCAELNI